LFAYSRYPEAFGDHYQANGNEGANGIPDILDEAKWGLDWLVKMNPDKDTYFNQVADDRDHAGMVLPTEQKVDYGWGAGKERPVYFCSPKPQGLFNYKNRSTGLASTLGKYTSSFALGAQLLAPYYPEFSKMLLQKAENAYCKGIENPGVCQTAPGGAPYFYEEDNWVDDMQLAAAEMYKAFQNSEYLTQAVHYGRMEPVTPWMGADSARHYQWYPFINLGNYHLAQQNDNPAAKAEFIRNMRTGLQRVKDRAQDLGDAFLNGIPFIWCSNNLTVGFISQCRLYHELTGDNSFLEIETAMRDWLLGCNPWGTSMIVGYPDNGDTPADPHSAFMHLHGMPITGGLVDGPIYTSIFNRLIGIYLANEDEYAPFQSDYVVYHDDFADWEKRDSTLVSRDTFENDLKDNYATMEKIGLKIEPKRYFIPPYEWYNQKISDWAKTMDVQIINFTPGTTSNADYTTPDMNNYLSSQTIYRNILAYEEKNTLNGFLLLMHIGTNPKRTDKLYNRLNDLIGELKHRGYEFVRVDELFHR